MKRLAMTVLAAGTLTMAGSVMGAEDVDITTGGTYDFQPASNPHGMLRNKVANDQVTFTQTAAPVDADHAAQFTGFDAVGSAKTLFSGGWWDFGAASDSQVNFFTNTATCSSRTTTLADGAVVTNVGTVWIAGSSGSDNTLILKGSSTFDAASVSFGSNSPDQRSTIRVEDGSSLNCRGDLFLTQFSVSTATKAKYLTGNILCVTGALSRLTVGGLTSVGGRINGTYGYGGGNTLEVVDGARANFAAVDVGRSSRQGQRNRIHFGKNARVNMTSLTVSNEGGSGYPAASNLIEIVDGACVTNTGAFVFGNSDNVARGSNVLLVSNAVFSVANCYVINASDNYFMCGPDSVFRLSGPRAQFVSEKEIVAFFKGDGCSFIIENGATWNWDYKAYYSSGAKASHETVRVRTGATLNCPNGLTTAGQTNVGASQSSSNKLIVESGAVLDSEDYISIYGKDGELTVDDGTVEVKYGLRVGRNSTAYDTNCLMRVCGSRPNVTVLYGLSVQNGSCLRFELPSTGYDANVATSSNPLLTVGSASQFDITFDDTSRLELTGTKELQAYHQERNLRREYVLIHANVGGINLPEGQLEVLQAQLPQGVSLFIRTVKNNHKELVLAVKPVRGLLLIVR